MPVRGLAQIRSLFGTVTILGYEITPETKDAVAVFCPTNVSSLCLETGVNDGNDLDEKARDTLREKLSQLQPESMTTEEVLSEMRSDSVLLHVCRLHHKPSRLITSHATHKYLYAAGKAKKTIQKEEISTCHKAGLFMIPTATQTPNFIEPSREYSFAGQQILAAAQTDGASPKVIFVGPKNSGKSTALKYIINCLQNHLTDVCYLECDPGQTEFTAPAILSLHVIKKPVLGPAFTHLQNAEKSYFLGDVNPANHADNYLKMIAPLYRQYCDNFSHLPLFINTMGWVEGLGLKLLREIAVMTSPTHLVQLVPQQENPVPVFNVGQEDGDQELEYFRIPSATNQSPLLPREILTIEAKSQSDSYQASSQREFNLLAAFSILLDLNPDARRITDVPPRVVPWSQVFIHVCHASVPLSEILYVANASIVGLCTTSKEELERCKVEEMSNGLRIISSTPVSECHGIGIIRGIDPEKRLLYILPAVPSEVLPKVNTLLIGAPSIPECVIVQQPHHGSEDVPYISQTFDTSIPGSLPIKPKTYLKRGPGGKACKA